MIGNFIGDFIKGKGLLERYETEIVQGIELHRSIDEFTDSHEVVQESKNRLRPKYRHYSGVIVDMFYDHLLAKNWSRYSKEPLEDFADRCYALIQDKEAILPEEVNRLMPYMISGNWLVNYAKTEGLHRALSGMARRTPFESRMEEAVTDLKENYSAFEKEFLQFYPELEKFAADWIASAKD